MNISNNNPPQNAMTSILDTAKMLYGTSSSAGGEQKALAYAESMMESEQKKDVDKSFGSVFDNINLSMEAKAKAAENPTEELIEDSAEGTETVSENTEGAEGSSGTSSSEGSTSSKKARSSDEPQQESSSEDAPAPKKEGRPSERSVDLVV